MSQSTFIYCIFDFLINEKLHKDINIYCISRFKTLLSEDELYKLPIWYKSEETNSTYKEIENHYLELFSIIYSIYDIKIISIRNPWDETVDLKKLKSTWYFTDKFNEYNIFKIFLEFSFRKMNFINKNIIQVDADYCFYINDDLEMILFSKRSEIENKVLKLIENNNFYIHNIKHIYQK